MSVSFKEEEKKMEVKALKVLSSINLDDLGLAIPTDFVLSSPYKSG